MEEPPSPGSSTRRLLQAFPWDTAPRVLLPDGDRNYGKVFRQTAAGLGIEEVLCAPRSPWQKTHRFLARFRRPNSAEWWSCPKSAGYTTGTNAAQPDFGTLWIDISNTCRH